MKKDENLSRWQKTFHSVFLAGWLKISPTMNYWRSCLSQECWWGRDPREDTNGAGSHGICGGSEDHSILYPILHLCGECSIFALWLNLSHLPFIVWLTAMPLIAVYAHFDKIFSELKISTVLYKIFQ